MLTNGAVSDFAKARRTGTKPGEAFGEDGSRTAKSCGPDAAVLASSCAKARALRGDGGKRAVHRGDHEVSRKATAQGRPGCSACTCMLVCSLFAQIARETAGAACTRSSLHPLLREGEIEANLGQNMSRDREVTSGRHPCEGGDPVFQRPWQLNREVAAYWVPRLRGGRQVPVWQLSRIAKA